MLRIGQVATGYQPLNDLGQVGGTGLSLDRINSRAFITQPNAPFNPATDLLAGTREGNGINNLGQVVGIFPASDGHSNGFRTRPGQPFDPLLDDLGGFGQGSTATAINNLGQATGYIGQAFRVDPGGTITAASLLGTLGGTTSKGYAINDAGQVVGSSRIAAGSSREHAFRTAPNAKINRATDDLGTLGGNESFANAINASGTVVGVAETATGNLHAFRTPAGRAIVPLTDDLGTLGGLISTAQDINDAGWIIGSSRIDPLDSSISHAFVFDGTTMWDLNDLVVTDRQLLLEFGRGINNSGQIVVDGFDFATGSALFLLTPIPVPEPASFVLLILGGFFALIAVRSKRSSEK